MPNVNATGEKNLMLARLINHQLSIIDKIEEIAKLLEKLSIAKQELTVLVRTNQNELEASFKDMNKHWWIQQTPGIL